MMINLLSPKYPPLACGVGDFNFFLSEALANQGNEVTVFSRAGTSLGKAKLKHFSELFQSQPSRGEFTLLQYTPQLFPSLVFCLRVFFHFRGKVSIFFHELFFPPSWSLRGLLIGVPHWLRFVFLLHLAERAIFSTARFYDLWSRRLPYLKGKMSWVPVGSCIPVTNGTVVPPAANTFRMLHFGGAHPTHLYEFVFCAFQSLREKYPAMNLQLVLVGVEESMLPQFAGAHGVHFKGYLAAEEVSSEFRAADLVLAPFMDGVTTRRSSLMAALAHGKAVVTTFGDTADMNTVPWKNFVAGSELKGQDPAEAYCKKVEEWVNVPKGERLVLGKKAQNYFESHFQWNVIAAAIQGILSEKVADK